MPCLLDTDIVIDHLARHPETTALIARLAPEGIAISIVGYMEVYQGIMRAADRERAEAGFDAFVATTALLPFSPAVARRCAALREQLRQEGKRVRARALDLIVAATALEHDLVLVTRNRDDYADIPDLRLHPG